MPLLLHALPIRGTDRSTKSEESICLRRVVGFSAGIPTVSGPALILGKLKPTLYPNKPIKVSKELSQKVSGIESRIVQHTWQAAGIQGSAPSARIVSTGARTENYVNSPKIPRFSLPPLPWVRSDHGTPIHRAL